MLHGKTSKIYHNKKGIYKNLPNPFEATRYHSLIINKRTLPEDFEITSQTEDGTIMGILNKKLNIEGVQFHPESILTKQGKKLIKNILKLNIERKDLLNFLDIAIKESVKALNANEVPIGSVVVCNKSKK